MILHSVKRIRMYLGIGILLVLVFFFLPSITNAQVFDWDNPDGDPLTNDSCLVNGVPTLKCAEVVVGNLLFMSNVLVILVLFVMFVMGSFKFMTSLGQSEKMEEAKKTFTWAIIGMVVYVSAYLVLFIIDQLLLGGNGDIFRFQIGT